VSVPSRNFVKRAKGSLKNIENAYKMKRNAPELSFFFPLEEDGLGDTPVAVEDVVLSGCCFDRVEIALKNKFE